MPGLPSPKPVVEALRGTPFEEQVIAVAEAVLRREFPLLGDCLKTGREIRWRRDYWAGIETGTEYFRRIPYLDVIRSGDHKNIWELNRHQHLVALAQAFLFTGERRFLDDLAGQLESWFAQNIYHRGINWTSALEVAFRALSWVWIYHLVGAHLPDGLRRQLIEELYRHGHHLENNLSVYFSPNTHLLGEAVVLYTLGKLFSFPNADRWQAIGKRWTLEQLEKQVRPDGYHFEQSTYYHVYALDMFLFYALLSGAAIQERLKPMAELLDQLLGPARALPFIGDDDGGRWFHPYGHHARYGLATLSTCAVMLRHPQWNQGRDSLCEQAAWWLGPGCLNETPATRIPDASHLFPACGLAVLRSGDRQIVFDAGPFGPGRAGHSHSDTLSFILRSGPEELLMDPATFTYVGDPRRRDWFRGSAAHNTVRMDGRDQAVPAGPFWWKEPPSVAVRRWMPGDAQDYIAAECCYGGFRHVRRLLWFKPDIIFIVDELHGPPGEHTAEQFWHCGSSVTELAPGCYSLGGLAQLICESPLAAKLETGGEHGWRSRALRSQEAAPVVYLKRRSELPLVWMSALRFTADQAPAALLHTVAGAAHIVALGALSVRFEGEEFEIQNKAN